LPGVVGLPPDLFRIDELVTVYCLRWVIGLLFRPVKSSFHLDHLDHLDTPDPQALRTQIYESLLAAVMFTGVAMTAANSRPPRPAPDPGSGDSGGNGSHPARR
jgi:hypothetical protein